MWIDRFIKFAGQWWLVLEQCPTGLALARDGTHIFLFSSAIPKIEALAAPAWSDPADLS